MSVAFRRESDEEHKEPRFELPIPPGPNWVTPRGRALIAARVDALEAEIAGAPDDAAREVLRRDLRYWHTRRATAEDALAPEDGRPGVAMVGLARALAFVPDLPNLWRQRETVAAIPAIRWRQGALNGLATLAMAKLQLRRMGAGKAPKADAWAPGVVACDLLRTQRRNGQYRQWLRRRQGA